MTATWDERREAVGLPPRIFLYTLDQVADIIHMPLTTLKRSHVYFYGRSTGHARSHLLRARNIALPESQPDWRIAENEFVRWMQLKGFKFKSDSTLLG